MAKIQNFYKKYDFWKILSFKTKRLVVFLNKKFIFEIKNQNSYFFIKIKCKKYIFA